MDRHMLKTRFPLGTTCIIILLLIMHYAVKTKTTDSSISRKLDSNIKSPVHSVFRLLLPENTHMYDCTTSPSFNTVHSSQFLKLQSTFDDRFNKVKNTIKEPIEGHKGAAFKFPQYRFYYRLAQEPWVSNICEIGFNAGHSATIWLGASPQHVRLHSFDMCSHKYTPPMAQFVKELFADRFNLTCGDSTQTLVAATERLRDKCDLVIIDGGHSYNVALADLRNFEPLANPEHHMLVIDDIPNIPSVGRAWQEVKADGVITEIVGCKTFDEKANNIQTRHKGFIAGVYRKKYNI